MSPKVLWQRIAIAAGIVLAVYVTYETFFTYNDVPVIPPAQVPIFLQGGQIINHHVQTKSWTLDYTSAQMSPDQSSGTINGIHNGIIFRKGKPYLEISARQASVNTITLDFTATGLVHVVKLGGGPPYSFDTDLIVWSNALHNLTLRHPSYFHTGGQTLEVQNVTIDVDTDRVHVGAMAGGIDLSK